MLWFKKKKKAEPREFNLPKGSHERFYVLADEVQNAGKADNVARYNLWLFVEGLFPEVEKGVWKWKGAIGAVKIIEVLK